jgi:hypothetical protein
MARIEKMEKEEKKFNQILSVFNTDLEGLAQKLQVYDGVHSKWLKSKEAINFMSNVVQQAYRNMGTKVYCVTIGDENISMYFYLRKKSSPADSYIEALEWSVALEKEGYLYTHNYGRLPVDMEKIFDFIVKAIRSNSRYVEEQKAILKTSIVDLEQAKSNLEKSQADLDSITPEMISSLKTKLSKLEEEARIEQDKIKGQSVQNHYFCALKANQMEYPQETHEHVLYI